MGTPAINLDKALAAMLENELCVGRL